VLAASRSGQALLKTRVGKDEDGVRSGAQKVLSALERD
jgi:hypothetical protein